MGAKAVPINEETGIRIKGLLKENKKTQKWLAEQLYITPENLSLIVNGKRGLLLERGKKIASLFPGVRVEWLMGEDNFKTEADVREERIKTLVTTSYLQGRAFDSLMESFGYKIVVDKDIKRLDDAHTVSILQGGGIVATCSFEMYSDMVDDINDYALFRVEKLIRKRSQQKEEN